MNSNSGDQFANFGRALSTTASALFSNQPMEDTILSYSSPYKKLLHQTITNSNGNTSLTKLQREPRFGGKKGKGFQSIFSDGKGFFQNSFGDLKTTFRVLSYISDEQLQNLPNEDESCSRKMITEVGEKKKSRSKKVHPSLYQGFESSLPVINETINKQHAFIAEGEMKSVENPAFESSTPVVENGNSSTDFSLPNNLTVDEINESYSQSFLKGVSQLIVDSLDILEIQKNLASSEIRELDIKMEKIKMMRELVFKRVAKIEQNELFLERHLGNVKDRIDMIDEYQLEQLELAPDEGLESFSGESTELQEDFETAATTPLEIKEDSSKLITTLTENETQPKSVDRNETAHMNGSSKRPKDMSFSHRHRQRKTYPTLQQFYEPGTQISQFENAHDEGITCLDFDMPFGVMCSAGNLDHSVKVWNLSKKTHVASMSGHLASINCMEMNQYMTLITGGRDAVLRLWDVERAIQEEKLESDDTDDICIHKFDAHIDEITALSLDRENIVSGSQDRTVRQWDLKSGKCVQTIDMASTTGSMHSRISTSRRNSMLLTSEPPIVGALQCYDAALATGTKDGVVRLWDLRSGKVVRTLEGHTGAITSLQFDALNLVTGSTDRSVRIWDLRTGTISDVFAYEHAITSLHFDLDKIIISNNEPTIKVYNRKDGTHTIYGTETDDDQNGIVEFVRYRHGYLVEGRSNGSINTWAV